MKTIYKSVLTSICALSFVLSINAQTVKQDTTYNRQVSVERDYAPVIQDASKINTLPAVQESAKPSTNVKYVTDLPAIEFSNYPITDTGSGDIATGMNFSKKRGYFIFGVGSNLNLDGRLGYRIVDSKTDRFDIFASYNSANSDVDYADDRYFYKEMKAKYSDAFVKAKYQHTFEPSILYINASFLNSRYNYYGNSFWTPSYPDDIYPFSDDQQSVNVFGAEAGVKSKESNEISYLGEFRFHHFGNKYGLSVNGDGMSGNIFEGKAGVGVAFDTDKKVAVEIGALRQNIGDVNFENYEATFHDLTVLKAKAHFDVDGGDWNISLGAKMNYAIDAENKFVIAPDVRASYTFAEKNSVYAIITGGINENHFLQTLMENRYVAPYNRINYSSTLYDATLGVKAGAVNGLEFDIFGGYKYTKDDHLYLSGSAIDLGNISLPIYANISEGHIGGQVKTKLIPYTDLALRAKAYFYDVKYGNNVYDPDESVGYESMEKKAWGKPSFTFDANADIRPVDKLTVTLNYIYKGGRKTFFDNASVKMKDINELNFRTEYQVLDWISVNVAFNNVLNQNYETFYGYTHQGFNAMAGVSLKF